MHKELLNIAEKIKRHYGNTPSVLVGEDDNPDKDLNTLRWHVGFLTEIDLIFLAGIAKITLFMFVKRSGTGITIIVRVY